MFRFFSILFFTFLAWQPSANAIPIAKTVQLSGKITDETNSQLLQGASVYFPELKKGVVTNDKGIYQISITPGTYIVEVSYIGYSLLTLTLTIEKNTEKDFALNHAVVENTNVTVTSFLRTTSSKKTPTPISIIKKEDFFKGVSTNFIDALSKTPVGQMIELQCPSEKSPLLPKWKWALIFTTSDSLTRFIEEID